MLTYSGDPRILYLFADALRIDPVGLVTPVNVAANHETALDNLRNGRREEPLFHYNRSHLERLSEDKRVIESGAEHIFHCVKSSDGSHLDQFILDLAHARLDQTLLFCDLARSILLGDDEKSGRLAIQIYGVPSAEDISAAEAATPVGKPVENGRVYSGQQISQIMQGTIKIYGFPGWNAMLSTSATAVCTREDSLLVPSTRQASASTVRKLIGHEVESHIRGSANTRHLLTRLLGEHNPLTVLVPWLAHSFTDEASEGVAKASDIAIAKALTGDGSYELPHPWYIIGITRALRHKLTFNEQMRAFFADFHQAGLDKEAAAERAWRYTYRIYRGVTRPQDRNFVFPKDFAYFSGYHQLQALEQTDPELYTLAQDFSSLDFEELSRLRSAWHQDCAKPIGRTTIASGNATRALDSLFEPHWPNLHLALDHTTLL